ncbi:hypothetical protein CMI42_04165, partial [Candidatus Pacearchaeota archaeon]|nr:hypothetical protein [Candidatus Pacearchaeota archaeon]
MAYISSFKGQDWLIPQSISDMIPKNHICFFVEEFVESLDFSGFDMINEGQGHPSYHPRILMKVLLQGMLSNERSSRKLANACSENFVFMYLAEKVNPNFRTFCRFRRQNAPFIKEVFKETIKLASKNDLVDLNLICTDGSKIKANASKKKFLKEDQVNQLDSIIDEMIEEDVRRDKQEEEIYGESEINKTSLETKNLKEIVKTYRKNKDKQGVKEICKAAKEEFKKDEKIKRVSMTDPDCRMMKGKKGNYELAYNTQFTADSKNQIILANDVCQDNADTNQLRPQIEEVRENIELKEDTKFAADSNYNNSNNLRFLEEENMIGYIPNQAQAQVMNCRDQTIHQDDYEYDWKNDEIILEGVRLVYQSTWVEKGRGKRLVYKSEDGKLMKRVPEFFRERLRMKKRMETKEGTEIYSKRKYVIEPVIGNVKYNYKFEEFSLRGLDGVRLELNLVSIAHNLKKIWRARMRLEDNNKNILIFELIF